MVALPLSLQLFPDHDWKSNHSPRTTYELRRRTFRGPGRLHTTDVSIGNGIDPLKGRDGKLRVGANGGRHEHFLLSLLVVKLIAIWLRRRWIFYTSSRDIFGPAQSIQSKQYVTIFVVIQN